VCFPSAAFNADGSRPWHAEIGRRIDDLETGKVQGIPLEETLAKARNITGQ